MAEIRKGYKETEIGIIPEDWEVKKLGEVADVKGGKRIPKGFTLVDEDTGYPYIRVADMNNGGVSLNDIKYVPIEVVEKISKYRISSKDIYISVAGTLGIVGVIPEALENANLTENADKICDIKCNRDFLAYFLRGKYIQKIIDNEKTLGAQPKLALTRIKTFNIALPPLKEQEKIAEILSATDKHIEGMDRLIEDYELLKKGMMQKLLTEGIGHTEFKDTEIGRIPKEWELFKAKEIFNTITDFVANGSFASLRENVKYLDEGGYAILVRLTDFKNDYKGKFVYVDEDSFNFLKKSSLEVNDIIVANVGANAGFVFKTKKLDKPMTLGPNAILIRTDYNSEYFYQYLSSEYGQNSIRGILSTTAQPKFNKTDFKNIRVPLPPLAEQEKIASILSSIDDHTNQLKESKDNYTNLKQGLMDRLLTGKIRVV